MAGKRKRYFGHIKQRPGRPGYYVVFRHPGHDKQIEKSAGPTRKIAESKLAKIQALVAQGFSLEEIKATVFNDLHGSRLSFREAVPMFLEARKRRWKPSTYKTQRQRLDLIKEAPWASGYLGKIIHTAVARWTETRMQRDGIAVATVNRDLSAISALFKWAMKMGYVDDNPIRKIERDKEEGRRLTWLEPTECWALVESMSPDKRAIVLAAIHTGMRRGELIALRWRDVDLARLEIEIDVKNEKTRRGRTLTVTGTLCDALAELKATRATLRIDRSDHVFLSAKGTPMKAGTISRAVKVAAQKCEGVAAEKRDKVTFHTLRHTAASFMVQRGVALYDLGKILGHTTPLVTQRYAHLAPDAAHKAISHLDAAWEEGRPQREVSGA